MMAGSGDGNDADTETLGNILRNMAWSMLLYCRGESPHRK